MRKLQLIKQINIDIHLESIAAYTHSVARWPVMPLIPELVLSVETGESDRQLTTGAVIYQFLRLTNNIIRQHQ